MSKVSILFIAILLLLVSFSGLCLAEIRFLGIRYLFSFQGKGDTEFGVIHRIAIDHDHNELYIADNTNPMRIHVADDRGILLGVIKNIGSVYDMAMDKKGRLYVSTGYEVKIVNYTGKVLGKLDLSQAPNPDGIVAAALHIGRDGRIYVGDNKDRRVIVFDENGHFLFQFDKAMDKRFIGITTIDTDNERIYVLDQGRAKVSVFDRDGNFLYWWGEISSVGGGFSQPMRLAIDPDGRVFVLDGNRAVVIAFSKDGKFLFEFGGAGVGPGYFGLPHDIRIDRRGRIYIADPGNMGVQALELMLEEVAEEPPPAPEPAPEPPKDEVQLRVEKEGTLLSVFFEADKAELKEDGKAVLNKDIEWLKKNPDAKIEVRGYADERGSDKYNIALSRKRAKAVGAYLASQGIATKRLKIVGYGREFIKDKSEEELARSRRVDLFIAGK